MKKTALALGILILLASSASLVAGQRFASGDSQDDFNDYSEGSSDRFDSGDSNDDTESPGSRFDSGDSQDDYNTGDRQDSTDTSDESSDDSRFDSGDSTDDSNEDGSRFDSGDSTDDAGEDGSRFDSGDSTDDSNEDGSRFDDGDSQDDSNENSDNDEDSDSSDQDDQDSSDNTNGGGSGDGVSSIDWPEVVVQGQNLDVKLSQEQVSLGETVYVSGNHEFPSSQTVNVFAGDQRIFEQTVEPNTDFRTGFTPSEPGKIDFQVSAGSESRTLELDVVSGLEISDIDMPPISEPGTVRACADISGDAEKVTIYRNGERQREEDAENRFCTLLSMEEGLNRIRFVARKGGMEAETSTLRRVGSGGGFETSDQTTSFAGGGGSPALGAFSGSETRLIGSILAGLAVVAGVLYREGVGVTEFISSIGS
ncbi:MAG: hypothetical protein H8Z69_02400 [Nanohaloarchaea archaeon]|nr:hypothetical protein [Candidatus Nanohaloarchaea archaeon]